MCARTCVCACVCVCVRAHVFECVGVWVRVGVGIYIYIYIYNTHIYICMYRYRVNPKVRRVQAPCRPYPWGILLKIYHAPGLFPSAAAQHGGGAGRCRRIVIQNGRKRALYKNM